MTFFEWRKQLRLLEAVITSYSIHYTKLYDTEIGILQQQGEAIAEHLGHDSVLIELGSGSPRKIRVLLDSLHPAVYMPVDISAEHLRDSASP